MWHERTKEARAAGKLVVLGLIQEQHADRCQLFAQWKGFDWPILHDPINLLGARAVPMFLAIDESGVVVDTSLRTSELDEFLARPPKKSEASSFAARPTAKALDAKAAESNKASDWIAAGDQRTLWGGAAQISTAIERYTSATRADAKNAAAQFRLGVALRMRYDSSATRPGDFQAAVDAWGRALKLDPNQYIYRRRIQQYGPRLIKPYPFYDWVTKARSELKAKGVKPHQLVVEPVGAEIAQPSRRVQQVAKRPEEPDPKGEISRDLENWIQATAIVVPGEIAKGDAVRVHLKLRPSRQAHWNNEAEPVKIWIDVPEGWQAESPLLETPQPKEPETRETRNIDFELRSSKTTDVRKIKAYALYYVCEDENGLCRFLRKDIEIPVRFRNDR